MARAVVVYRQGTAEGPPTEYGRAVLNADQSVTVTGLSNRPNISTQGIYDWQRKQWQTPRDGPRFLDLLLMEFRSGYVYAVEEDV